MRSADYCARTRTRRARPQTGATVTVTQSRKYQKIMFLFTALLSPTVVEASRTAVCGRNVQENSGSVVWQCCVQTAFKVAMWTRGGMLTWRSQVGPNPIPIPHPTNSALFGHKITLYRFNQVGLILLQGVKSEQGGGAEPRPAGPLTLTTV